MKAFWTKQAAFTELSARTKRFHSVSSTMTARRKSSIPKAAGGYIVSPYAILWNDGNCYLYAYEEEKERFSLSALTAWRYPAFALPRVGKDEYKEKDLTARRRKFSICSPGKNVW